MFCEIKVKLDKENANFESDYFARFQSEIWLRATFFLRQIDFFFFGNVCNHILMS